MCGDSRISAKFTEEVRGFCKEAARVAGSSYLMSVVIIFYGKIISAHPRLSYFLPEFTHTLSTKL